MTNRSIPRRAAVFAACLGVTAAVGAVPALAATQSEAIFGNGSSLQKVAQIGGTNGAGFVWQGWASTWHNTAADRTTLSCASNPGFPNPCTSTYTSTSSGSGLAEFGNAGSAASCPGSADAVLDNACDSVAHNGGTNGYGTAVLDSFVGTDDPPTTTNLSNASTAATGGGGTTIHEITVPVAQAPVSLMLSLPTGVNIGQTNGKFGTVKLSNATVQQVFNDSISPAGGYAHDTWGALLSKSGLKKVAANPTATQFTDTGNGTSPITLQARSSGSGTSFTVKDFLNISGDANYTSAFVVDDPTWPVTTEQCNETPTSNCPFGANSGGGTLAKNVAAMPGSIGYANLADAAEAALGNGGSCPPATQFGYTNLSATINCVSGSSFSAHQVLYAQVQINYDPNDASNPNHTTNTCTVGGIPNKPCPVHYASPQTGTAGVANVYVGSLVSVNGSAGVGHWVVPKPGGSFDPTGSWSGAPNDPNLYNTGFNGTTHSSNYPVVAATYDLGWDHYAAAGSNLVGAYGGSSAQATAAGASAASYLQYLAKSTTGQANLVSGKQYYAKLPAVIDGFAVTAAGTVAP